jgi:hypothetical protein
VVLAEAARAAGSRGEEEVPVRRLLLAVGGGLPLQEADEAAGGEDGRAARADVDELLAGVEVLARGCWGAASALYFMLCMTPWISRSCFQVRPPKRMVVRSRSSLVNGLGL